MLIHLADAFIQSNLQCIQAIHLFSQNVCSLGIEPTTFCAANAMLTTEPQEHHNAIITVYIDKWSIKMFFTLRKNNRYILRTVH